MANEKPDAFHFGDVVVDTKNFRVVRDGQEVTLTPRAFDVLVFLIRNSGRVVEKQELFSEIWKGTFVSDNALTKVIKEIRHTLNDDATAPRYIETIPKRGYRFMAEVMEGAGPSAVHAKTTETFEKPRYLSRSSMWLAVVLLLIAVVGGWLLFRSKKTEVSAPNIQTIAVLPFKPLNAEARDESLEMGMAETLITRLSNLKQVVVRPMSAVRKYTDLQQDPIKAGQEVQAEAVLDGSIQKVGERVRVTVRLINVRSGEPVWSEQFDENFTDIFKVQDSIAERITTALTLQLSRPEKEQLAKHLTDNPEAYQLYLRAQLL